MPPLLIVGLGAIGAAWAARILVREGRRVNAELDRHRAAEQPSTPHDESRTLRRDGSGVYRPD